MSEACTGVSGSSASNMQEARNMAREIPFRSAVGLPISPIVAINRYHYVASKREKTAIRLAMAQVRIGFHLRGFILV